MSNNLKRKLDITIYAVILFVVNIFNMYYSVYAFCILSTNNATYLIIATVPLSFLIYPKKRVNGT